MASSKVVSVQACNKACMQHQDHMRSEIVGPWLCQYHRVVCSILDRARSSRHFWRAVETRKEHGYRVAVYRNNFLEYTLFFNCEYYNLYDARSHKFVILENQDGWDVTERARHDCLRAARQNNFEVRRKSRDITTASMPWNVLEVQA